MREIYQMMKGQAMGLKILLSAVFLSLLFIPEGHAYLDPGTGGMLLQMLAAGFVAILVFGRQIWNRVSGMFAAKEPSAAESLKKEDDDA